MIFFVPTPLRQGVLDALATAAAAADVVANTLRWLRGRL